MGVDDLYFSGSVRSHLISGESSGGSPVSCKEKRLVGFPIFDFRDCGNLAIESVLRDDRIARLSLADADFDRARVIDAHPSAGIADSGFHRFDFCLTSKMSEADAWRGACDSTIRDKRPASLHRIVRLRFHTSDLQADRV